jgi:hypothetical protein
VRRYPTLTAIALGLVAGLVGIGVVVLAADSSDDRQDGAVGLPDEAVVYRLAADTTPPQVVRLARVFAVGTEEAGVTNEDGAWIVRADTRTVRVMRQAALPWTYEQSCPNAVASSAGEVTCGAPVQGRLPRAEAMRVAREYLSRLGTEPTADLRLTRSARGWQAAVDPEVEGLPTVGIPTTITIGHDGEPFRASGHLVEPQELGRHRLVSTDAAQQRLRRRTDAVTGVRLGLTLVSRAGSAYLVPAARFRLAGGKEESVPALADDGPLPPAADRPQTTSDSTGRSCNGRTTARNGTSVRLRLCAEPTTVAPGVPVSFEVTAAREPADPPPCTAGVDFGDGSGQDIQSDPAPRTLTHGYANPGRYTVRLLGCDTGREVTVRVSVAG